MINYKYIGNFFTLIGALALFTYLFGFSTLIAFTPVLVGGLFVIGLIKFIDWL